MTGREQASDADVAARIATEAGLLLLQVQQCGIFPERSLGKAGDAVAQAFIAQALATLRPDDIVLSEEAVADPQRLSESRVWIVDPLDGTREYSECRNDWAVHVALAIDGRPDVGAVALPALDMTFRTDSIADLPKPSNGAPRMLVSRTRPAPQALNVAERLKAELVPMGSAGAKAMAVLRGEADIYLHAGGQYEWDSCAPAAVARAAGLHVSRIDGSPCVYNRPNPYMPDLLICRPELAEAVRGAIADCGIQGEAA